MDKYPLIWTYIFWPPEAFLGFLLRASIEASATSTSSALAVLNVIWLKLSLQFSQSVQKNTYVVSLDSRSNFVEILETSLDGFHTELVEYTNLLRGASHYGESILVCLEVLGAEVKFPQVLGVWWEDITYMREPPISPGPMMRSVGFGDMEISVSEVRGGEL